MDQAFPFPFLRALLSHAVVEAELKNRYFFGGKKMYFWGGKKTPIKRNVIVKS